jgi:predicted phage-related endonuclease
VARDLTPIATVLAAYQSADRQIKELEAAKKDLQEAIVHFLGDEEEGQLTGVPIVAYRKTNGFASAKFRDKYPDLANQVTMIVQKESIDMRKLRKIAPEALEEFAIRRFTTQFGVI